MSVDTNANAELAMRVKALESDVAELQRRLVGTQGALELLIGRVEKLRAGAGGK